MLAGSWQIGRFSVVARPLKIGTCRVTSAPKHMGCPGPGRPESRRATIKHALAPAGRWESSDRSCQRTGSRAASTVRRRFLPLEGFSAIDYRTWCRRRIARPTATGGSPLMRCVEGPPEGYPSDGAPDTPARLRCGLVNSSTRANDRSRQTRSAPRAFGPEGLRPSRP